MQIERRALYNLMRMNWLIDPSLPAEPWQVEDYRSLPLSELFERLDAHDLRLDRNHFIALSEEMDSPEELTDQLLHDVEMDVATQDQIYLLMFELWRRLVTDRPCLSIFCDELDYQIYHYDHDRVEFLESIQDAIANLQVILDENNDVGIAAKDVFASICAGCANNVENFLYDYISDQIDNGNNVYAGELVEGFAPYIAESKWFDFLQARIIAISESASVHELAKKLIELYLKDDDLEFNLELLSFIIQTGDRGLLLEITKKTLPLIATEEDFQDLLNICADFYHQLDLEAEELKVQKIIRKRSHFHIESSVREKDPHKDELLAILSL